MANQSTQIRFISELSLDPTLLVRPPAKWGHDLVDPQCFIELFFGLGDTQHRLE
ncbi:MAG: hypothetical protein RL215_795 [Planctomycetota bacterium]